MKAILSIDPIRFPLTGIGRYTFELARHLEQLTQLEQLLFFSGNQFVNQLPSEGESDTPDLAFVGRLRRLLSKSPIAVDYYRWRSSCVKRQALRGYEGCVYHGPNYYLPPFKGPSVCTFHDLSMYTWAHCSLPERVRYMRKEIALTLKRADILITDSEYTRQEIAAYFNWPLARIRAVSLACSADFRPRSHEELFPILKKYGLETDGYTLYVGTIEPRKNIDTLLDAYELLSPILRKRWPLVLIGYQGWRSEHLHARIEAATAEGWVKYLGYVAEHELPFFFSGARLFVFPSLYEGFGLPVLEAMSSGTPVVCSNSSSLPEVTGNAAAMCEARDVDALSSLIAIGLEDDAWRTEAQSKGIVQAGRFSWRRCAEETARVYGEVVS
ncbi:glycosyltransferase family 1 protein [Ferrovum sp.]|uniref:glycosyltransferase family 4 protein n=1 Tax=Ferrovum sp. TaxID=2609467 RepID=UPI00344F0D7C